ncbi:hypothetical protein X760_31320 [Mesorhizobium sp. LSHC422A00]|nr:hypothetical protein X760_31320 [Mesorhizobium sp. LSHC422A00]
MGFFWIVVDRIGHDAILADAIGLADAEQYGEVLTHPGGHYDYWETMKQRGPTWLRARNVSASLLQTDYEDWPRGRVVYSIRDNRPIVYADPRVKTKSRIELVRAAFQIPDADHVIRKDSHYRPSLPSIMPDDEN